MWRPTKAGVGGMSELLGGVAALGEDERRWRRATGTEKPSALASIGRGFVDVVDPALQAWYDATDRGAAQRLRKERGDEESLYLRGKMGHLPQEAWASTPDFYRGLGRGLLVAASIGGGPLGALMGAGGGALQEMARPHVSFDTPFLLRKRKRREDSPLGD